MTELKDGGAPLAVVATPVLEALTRTQIESQMEWAWKHKRDLADVRRRALAAATQDEATAKECFYKLPARGDGGPIQGSSVRLAEIVYSIFGNLRAESRIIDIGPRFVTAQGVCLDLETNVARSVEVPRRITNKKGVRYGDDMIGITCMAAMSIAFRNAVLQVVPAVYTDPICEAAIRMAIGTAETLGKRRHEMIVHYQKMGVHAALVLQSIGRESIDDVTLKDLETLVGVANAIKGGDMSIDEAFPGVSDTKEKPKSLAEHVEKEQAKEAEPAKKRGTPLEGPPPEATQELAAHRKDLVDRIKALNKESQEYVFRNAGMKSVSDVEKCTQVNVLAAMRIRVTECEGKPVTADQK